MAKKTSLGRYSLWGAALGLVAALSAAFIFGLFHRGQTSPYFAFHGFSGLFLGALVGGLVALFSHPRSDSKPQTPASVLVLCALYGAPVGAALFFLVPCTFLIGGVMCGMVGYVLGPIGALVGAVGGVIYAGRYL